MKPIQLSIPDPCTANWSGMEARGEGRYCALCQKTVVDFASMSDSEVLNYLNKARGPVCGRLRAGQLNRTFMPPHRPFPFSAPFFRLLLPAFLLASKAQSQEKLGRVKQEQRDGQKEAQEAPLQDSLITYSGKVVDADGNPVWGAFVKLSGVNSATTTDAEGNFSIRSASKNPRATISSVGFETLEVQLEAQKIYRFTLHAAVAGEVIVTGGIGIRKRETVPLLQQLVDTAFSRFSLYPNPSNGEAVFLKRGRLKKGRYSVALSNASGAILATSLIDLTGGEIRLPFGALAAGAYLVTLTSAETGRKYSEKLICR
jgi:hypothetical protein